MVFFVGRYGKRQIAASTSAERGTSITPDFMEYESVTDEATPPVPIEDVPPRVWVETDLFTRWQEHFIHKTKLSAESQTLFILDGNYSNTQRTDCTLRARKNHITVISLPSKPTQTIR